jgi:hypothetical protein
MFLTRRNFLTGALAAAAVVLAAMPGARADPDGVAMMGYDAVAYFHQAKAVPGAGNISLRWRGLLWHFASVENRAAFEADPRAYAPQFGGLCPLALRRGDIVAGDPRNWIIHAGKLYLSSSPEGLERLRHNGGAIIPEAATEFRTLKAR